MEKENEGIEMDVDDNTGAMSDVAVVVVVVDVVDVEMEEEEEEDAVEDDGDDDEEEEDEEEKVNDGSNPIEEDPKFIEEEEPEALLEAGRDEEEEERDGLIPNEENSSLISRVPQSISSLMESMRCWSAIFSETNFFRFRSCSNNCFCVSSNRLVIEEYFSLSRTRIRRSANRARVNMAFFLSSCLTISSVCC